MAITQQEEFEFRRRAELERAMQTKSPTEEEEFEFRRRAELERPALPDRTIGQSVTDVGAGLATGLGKVAQFPGQLYGLATGDMEPGYLTKKGKELEQYGTSLESPQLKAAKVERDTAVQEAAKTGEWEAFKTTFSRTVSNPALITNFLAETAPQLIPSFGAARVVGMGAMAGKKALTGEAKEAAIKKAGAAGTAAAIGTGATQQGADIGAQTFEDISKHLEKNGMSKEEAAAASIGYARATGAGAAVISLLAQKLPGAKRMEEAFAGVPGTQKGVIGRFVSAGKTGVGEAGSEVVEETGGKLLQNVAMQQEAPETQLTAGLGQTAAMAALGGAGMGAGVGAISPSAASPEAAPEVPGAEVPAGEVTPTTEGEVTPPEVIPTTEVTPPEETTEVPATEEEPSIGDYHIGKIEPLAPMLNQIQTKAEQQDVVAQMESVATNPDYSSLGKSDNIDTGAPVIISDYKIPNDLMGNVEEITGENGDNIKVQYAVLEADGILTANSIEGMPNPDYTNTEERGTRAIYGNNRITGLQAAYNNGTATDYTPALLDDPAHGIDPAVIAGMDRPVLVRVIPKSELLGEQNAATAEEATTTETEETAPTEEVTGDQTAPITEAEYGKQVGAKQKLMLTNVVQAPTVGLDPIKSTALGKAVLSKDTAQVLDILAQSKNPIIRTVAGIAKGPNHPWLSVGTFSQHKVRRNPGVLGLYAPRFGLALIKNAELAKNDWYVAHEVVHHLAYNAIGNPTPGQKAAVDRLNTLFNFVKADLTKKGKGDAYAFKDMHEFVSEGMSNPNFQYELRSIKYQNTTAWGAFTKYIGQMLGLKNDTALSELLAITEHITTQKSNAYDPKVFEAGQSPLTMEMSVGDKFATGFSKDVPPDLVDKLEPIFDPKKTNIIDKIKSLRENFWAKMAQGLADQYRTIKDYSEEGYMLARLSKSVDGMLEGLLFNGEATLTDGALDVKKNTQGLMKVMEPVGTEVSRYQIWVALSRDADLVKSGKAPSVDKGIVKRRDELVKGTLNGRPRLEVYKEVQRGMNKLNRSVLRIALKQGLIDLAAYKIFARDINYIPFYKIMEDGDLQGASTATGLSNQYFSKGLKGGEKPFGDLMENTLRNWSHILSASMKNQALGTTLKDATELGASYPNLKKGMEWRDGKVIHSSTGKPIGDGSLKPQYTTAGKGMVKVMMGGKPAYFEVIDPMLVESISAISYTGPQSKFLDVARDFKNILQFGVTISPAFKIRNLFRDSVSALAVTDLKYNPFSNVIEGWEASNKNNPAHISALSGGAIFNFGTLYEGNQAKLIKRLLAMGVKPENILDTPDKVKTGLSVAWRAYQDWGNKSESANRMALYNQLKERGMDHMQATFYARDLLDFSMQGAFPAMRYLTQVVPFLNARVQGLYKLGRDGVLPTSRVIYNASTGKPIDATDKQKAQRFSIVSGAVAMASLALYFAFKDDEEFKKREEWDRDNFWWFKLPGMEHAIRIPKPFEIGAIGTMAERVAEQIVDNKAEGKVFGHSLARMMGDTFAMNPMPQMFKPLVDLYANKDSFTGAPIETAGMERLSKAERASDTTSTLAKSVSGVANTVLPESLHMSPVQADYAIKSYFGWLGGTISATSNYAVMPFSKSVYPDRNWTDTISLGFVKSLPSAQNKAVTAFYENNREIQTAFADMRHYAAIGEVDKVNDILKEKGDKIALSKSYDNASDDMAKMRKYISVINRDEKMDGAQKRAEIDRMKILIGKLAEQMEDVRKSLKK